MDAKRRLSAVWFADIVGYTTLSRTDEPAALKLVSVLQDLAREIVAAHDGRLVKFIGDAVLSEFSSTDAAVRAAVALQERYDDAAAASGHPSQLRVGVHLGEVTPTPDGDLYGDGINTAARLHQEAVPGRVIISEDVWRQLRQRPEFRFAPLGAVELRGITTRVEVYDVLFGTRAALGAREATASGAARSTQRRGQVAVAAVVIVALAAAAAAFALWSKPAAPAERATEAAPPPAPAPVTEAPPPSAPPPQTRTAPPTVTREPVTPPPSTPAADPTPPARDPGVRGAPPATADRARERDGVRQLLERFASALASPNPGTAVAALGPGAQMMSRRGAPEIRTFFGEGFEARLGRVEPLATRADSVDVRFIVLGKSTSREVTPLAFTATIAREAGAFRFTQLRREPLPARGRGRSGVH